MRTISTVLCLLFFVIISNFSEAQTEVQRVRIDFQNSDGFTRHLLLGFVSDNSATDGFDYGYDALNPDNLPDDLNWIIEDNRYVIQGVGEFNTDKYYPLGMFLSNSGDIVISLNELENFNEPIDVYLYDLELDTYTLLNSEDYINNLLANTYLNRFYLTFSNTIGPLINSNNLLLVEDNEIKDLKIWHSNLNDELFVKGLANINESTISLYTIEGKKLVDKNISYSSSYDSFKISTSGMSKGIYILKIDSSTFSHTEKICIAN